MNDHMQHHLANSIRCDCGKIISGYLQQNQEECHLTKHDSFRCEECMKNHEFQTELMRLKQILQETLPFKCNLCSYRSSTLDYLRSHRAVHYAIRKYTCNQCNFETIKEAALEAHMKCHGEYDTFDSKFSSLSPMQ